MAMTVCAHSMDPDIYVCNCRKVSEPFKNGAVCNDCVERCRKKETHCSPTGAKPVPPVLNVGGPQVTGTIGQ